MMINDHEHKKLTVFYHNPEMIIFKQQTFWQLLFSSEDCGYDYDDVDDGNDDVDDDDAGDKIINVNFQVEVEGHPPSIRFIIMSIMSITVSLQPIFFHQIFPSESRLEVPRTCCSLLNVGVRQKCVE